MRTEGGSEFCEVEPDPISLTLGELQPIKHIGLRRQLAILIDRLAHRTLRKSKPFGTARNVSHETEAIDLGAEFRNKQPSIKGTIGNVSLFCGLLPSLAVRKRQSRCC